MPRLRSTPSTISHAAHVQPTGVPLVDRLMSLSSLNAAALHSLHLLAFLAAAAVCGRWGGGGVGTAVGG